MGPVMGVFRSPSPCRQAGRQAGSLDGSSLFFSNKNRGLRAAYHIQVTSETAAACHQPRGTDKQHGHLQVSDTSHFRNNEYLSQQSMMSWRKLWSYHLAFQLRQTLGFVNAASVYLSLCDFHISSFITSFFFFWQTLSETQKKIKEFFFVLSRDVLLSGHFNKVNNVYCGLGSLFRLSWNGEKNPFNRRCSDCERNVWLTLEAERGIAGQDQLGRRASGQREQAHVQLDSSVSTQRGNKTQLQTDWVARAGRSRKWVNWWVHLWCGLFRNRRRAPSDGWRGLSEPPGSCGRQEGISLASWSASWATGPPEWLRNTNDLRVQLQTNSPEYLTEKKVDLEMSVFINIKEIIQTCWKKVLHWFHSIGSRCAHLILEVCNIFSRLP